MGARRGLWMVLNPHHGEFFVHESFDSVVIEVKVRYLKFLGT